MDDRIERHLRDTARSARTEVEGRIDIDAELDTVRRADRADVPLARDVSRRRGDTRRGPWIAAAAAAIVALTAGIWFVDGRDESIDVATTQTAAAPATTVATTTPTTPTTPVTTTPADTVSATTATGYEPTTVAPTTVVATAVETTVDTTIDTTTVATSAPTTTEATVPTTAATESVPTVNWRDRTWEGSGIAGSCSIGAATCTQLVHDADGAPITYEPMSRRLTRHDVPEVAVTLPAGYGDAGFVVHAGPDDVVYLAVAPAAPDEADEMAADVVAVTLTDGDAGREIGRWDGATNTVGDSSLVATPDGLVNVNCCGPDTVRPAPDADVLVPWVDRSGADTTLDSPTFRVEIEYPALTVHRRNPDGSTQTWTYEPAGEWMPRGMPNLTATFDGGFVAAEFGSGGSTIARGYADGRLDQMVLGPDFVVVDAVDPAGRILIGDVEELDGWFARVDLFANGTAAWTGEVSVEPDGSLRFDDTSDIAAGSAVSFVAAIVPPPDVNEIRTIETAQRSVDEWSVTVTTSNLYDDSTAAVRWELDVRRVGPDEPGWFEVTSGRSTQSCQPDRGHQDFSNEPCI